MDMQYEPVAAYTKGASTITHTYPSALQALAGRAERGAWSGDFRGIEAGLCRISHVNFAEFLFHALR
jgi:hypothetical protein